MLSQREYHWNTCLKYWGIEYENLQNFGVLWRREERYKGLNRVFVYRFSRVYSLYSDPNFLE